MLAYGLGQIALPRLKICALRGQLPVSLQLLLLAFEHLRFARRQYLLTGIQGHAVLVQRLSRSLRLRGKFPLAVGKLLALSG